jgi:hypothetical protein
MTSLEKKISSNPKMASMYESFINRNNNFWNGKISTDVFTNWLENFDGDEELYYALKLADNIYFYTFQEINYLCETVFLRRCKSYFFENFFPSSGVDFHRWFKDVISKHSIFIGLGSAEKSGKMILPIFNKACSSFQFETMEEFEFLHTCRDLGHIRFVFIIDDFIGSGNQAVEYWKTEKEGKSYHSRFQEMPKTSFIYLSLVGMKDGKDLIERKTPLKVFIGDLLDDRFRCFSDSTIIFKDPYEREKAKRIMETKGLMLCKHHPLGYENSQLAIAFHHNTPDNTLPVIWKKMSDNSWHPLFERKEKQV